MVVNTKLVINYQSKKILISEIDIILGSKRKIGIVGQVCKEREFHQKL